jgi:hypothetical protein
MQKLPVDISTFSELRKLNYVYVDKTEHMYTMITHGRRYFLSRPRRFGKSLLISTLKEILIGNKKLFEDLWIGSSDYDWHEHGVIQLDFSKLEVNSVESLENYLKSNLIDIAYAHNIILLPHKQGSIGLLLENIVDGLYQKYGHVAILVDEYDSPILKTLDNSDLAIKIRNSIQQFFTTIKALDAHVNFVFITGVSSFAKAGLFSGINNLQIMTLDEQYATVCGYTSDEIELYFKDHITAWSERRNIPYTQLKYEIKTWYNC